MKKVISVVVCAALSACSLTGYVQPQYSQNQAVQKAYAESETVNVLGEDFYKIDLHNFDKVNGKANFTIDKTVGECTRGSFIAPNNIINDGMVLQRNAISCLWGTSAYANQKIAAEIAGKVVYGEIINHEFKLYLPPLEAGGPYDLVFYTPECKLTIKNVLIGEVLLFSGQSNMSWAVKDTLTKGKEYLRLGGEGHSGEPPYVPSQSTDPDTYKYYNNTNSEDVVGLKNSFKQFVIDELTVNDNIRIFNMPASYTERDVVTQRTELKDSRTSCTWQSASYENLNAESYTFDGSLWDLSLFAYYFSKELQEEVDIPVGVISASWGATTVNCWVPQDVFDDYCVGNDSGNEEIFKYGSGNVDIISGSSRFYNTFISPILNYKIRATLWVQGENQYDKYAESMKLLIDTWRERMDNPNMGFQLVEHHRCGDGNYTYFDGLTRDNYKTDANKERGIFGASYYLCRIEQQRVATLVDNCTVSAGMNTGDYDDCHDSDKRAIAHQAVGKFREYFYGQKQVLSGPQIKSAKLKGNDIILTFDNVADGLLLKNDGINFCVTSAENPYEASGLTNTANDTAELRAERLNDTQLALHLDGSSMSPENVKYVIYGALDYPRISRLDMSTYVSVYNSEGYPSAQFVQPVSRDPESDTGFELLKVRGINPTDNKFYLSYPAIDILSNSAQDVREHLTYRLGDNAQIESATYSNFKITVTVKSKDGGKTKTYTYGVTGVLAGQGSFNQLYTQRLEEIKTYEKGKTVVFGDSITEYWTTFKNDLAPLEVYNVGIGGTRITDWTDSLFDELVLPLEPSQIIVYVGCNDIYNNAKLGKPTGQYIIDFFETVHEKLPDTKIHYVSINPPGHQTSPLYQKLDEVKISNAMVKAFCEFNDYIQYIDTYNSFIRNGVPTTKYFRPDYLHFSEDGYKKFTSVIRKSVGIF